MVRTIWSFVGAAIAIVSGLSAVHVWRHYEDQLAANITLVRTATAMSQSRISAAILSIDMVLSETGRDLVAGKLDDRAAAADRLKTRKDAFPDIRHLFVVGTNGASLLGTIPSAVGTEISDRDYFRRALSAPRAAMVISEPLGSRIEPVTSIFLARQVRDAANSVRGGVVAALDPVFFEKNLRSVFTETGHHAAIIRRDGVVLARVPDPAEWLGKTLTGSDLFRHVQQGATGTFVGPTFGDGTRRITGYADIPGHDAIVCLSLSYHDALASWRSSAVVIGCANLAFIATALFLAFSLSRRRGEEERALALVAAAEAKAALQAERLDLALRGANDSWWDWDLKADKAYYSPRWFAMIGYRPDELEADSGLWRRQMHPDDQAGVDRVIAEVVRTRSEAVELEFRLRHKDGGWVPILARGHVIYDEAGQPVRTTGTNTDLTERKRAEAELRASEATFRSLFELSPYGMIRTAEDASFRDVNQAFLDIVGYDRQTLLGLTCFDLTPEAYAAEEAVQLACLKEVGRYGPYEKEYIHRSGRRVPVRLRGVVISGSDGRPYVWSIVEDIREQRAAERAMTEAAAELARSNADLEQFAYVASHDLREPLRMVSAYVGLLERRFSDVLGTDGREFVAFARDGAQRMDQLICDLLDYSRVKRMGGDIVPTSADEALEIALRNLRAAITRAGAEVTVGPLPVVLAAPVQLQRLFQNLIGNALKYRHPDRAPRIEVTAQSTDGEVTISVADNGIGIDPQYHERVFGIFQRLHTRQEYEGTGIGLAVCRGILERHGGRIWVESLPGEGATFRFTLKAGEPAGG